MFQKLWAQRRIDGIGQIGHGRQGLLESVAVVAHLDEHAVLRHMLIEPAGFQPHLLAKIGNLLIERIGYALGTGQIGLPVGFLVVSRVGVALAFADKQRVKLCGIISSKTVKTTKNGASMAFITVEDKTGAALFEFVSKCKESGIDSEAALNRYLDKFIVNCTNYE